MTRRVVSFDRLLDAMPASCAECDREGKVDRWTYRDAHREGDDLVCLKCDEDKTFNSGGLTVSTKDANPDRELSNKEAAAKGLPKLYRTDIEYDGEKYPWSAVPDDLLGEPSTERNLRKLAEALEDEEPE